MAFRKTCRDICCWHRCRNDYIFSIFPVCRGSHAILGGQLQGVQYTEHFYEVPSCRGRVGNDELYFLVWSDNKQRSDRKCFRGIWMNHIIQVSHCFVFVCNNRKSYVTLLCFVNIIYPAQVFIQRINAYSQHFSITFCELVL